MVSLLKVPRGSFFRIPFAADILLVKLRYGIIGSRTFFDYDLLKNVLQKHYISQIVSGGARGADSLAIRYAIEASIPYIEFIPDYKKYRKKAPFVRNKLIVNASDIIIAFWDGKSTGTKHSLDYAKKLAIKSIVIEFNTEPTSNMEIDLWQL